MENITNMLFVCIDNPNCPANHDTSKTIFSYQETHAIPDKKNETCCPRCNSLLMEKVVYDKILELKKRKKQRIIITVLISIMIILLIIVYYISEINN